MHKILRLPKVMDTTGLPQSTIYQRILEKSFPAPISLGPKTVGWVEADIQNWIQDKISASQTANQEGQDHAKK